MEEVEIGEVGVDKFGEQAREKARERKNQTPWLQWLALSTALFAVWAPLRLSNPVNWQTEALLRMNEATLKQAQASDAWAYYQAKGVKQITREAEADTLSAANAPAETVARIRADAERYKTEQEDIQKEARQLEKERKEAVEKSAEELEKHHRFAYAVTMLQVAIGLSAIAALVERRAVWLFALCGGLIGVVLFIFSVL